MTNFFIFLCFLFSSTYLQSAEWKKLFHEDNISVYANTEAKGIIPFKAIGSIDADVDLVLKVLKDLGNKNQWAPKLKNVKVHVKKSEQEYTFSEYYSTPWPASDREFLLRGSIEKSGSTYRLLASSFKDASLEDEDHIQAEVKKIDVILKPLGDQQTEITFEFYGDMKGWMPTWLINLIQKRWPYLFIQGLRKRVSALKA